MGFSLKIQSPRLYFFCLRATYAHRLGPELPIVEGAVCASVALLIQYWGTLKVT